MTNLNTMTREARYAFHCEATSKVDKAIKNFSDEQIDRMIEMISDRFWNGKACDELRKLARRIHCTLLELEEWYFEW